MTGVLMKRMPCERMQGEGHVKMEAETVVIYKPRNTKDDQQTMSRGLREAWDRF